MMDPVAVKRIDDPTSDEEWLDVKDEELDPTSVRTAVEGSFELIHNNTQNVNESSVKEGVLMNSAVKRNEPVDGGEGEQDWTSWGNQLVDKFTSCVPVGSEKWKTVTILLLVSVLFYQNLNHQHRSPSLMETDGSISSSSDYSNDYVLSLIDRIEDLQYANDQYSSRLSRLAVERANWRSLAISCDADLKRTSHSSEEVVVMDTKRGSVAGSVVAVFEKKAMSSVVRPLSLRTCMRRKNRTCTDAMSLPQNVELDNFEIHTNNKTLSSTENLYRQKSLLTMSSKYLAEV